MKDDNDKEITKAKNDWTIAKDQTVEYNLKTLNAIFNGEDANQFKLISTCTIAKEAWEILQVAYEGPRTVQLSKPQNLLTRFENLMDEDETISTFNIKLCDIANEVHALGEPHSNMKLLRKALRFLPKRFVYKVATIEKARGVTILKLEELIGSL